MPFLIGALLGALLALLALGAPFLSRKGKNPACALALNGDPLAGTHCVFASNFVLRLAGLLNHARLGEGDALWLPRTSAIHTFAMAFSIDAVFLSAEGEVLSVEAKVTPGRRLSGPPASKHVVELAAGEAARMGIAPGGQLALAAPT